jgi:hypothetical protein
VTENSRMRHRAHGALVAGNLGILGVDVSCLNKARENDDQDTENRQRPKDRLRPRIGSASSQISQLPTMSLQITTKLVRCTT